MAEPGDIFEGLKAAWGDGIVSMIGSGQDRVILVRQDCVRPVLEHLKASGFNMLMDLTAADYSRFGQGVEFPGRVSNPAPAGSRFKLTYRLMSLDPGEGLVRSRVAVQCWIEGEKGPVSVRDLWPCADWLEREAWDMFGVPFADRPDIRRILLYKEFVGHPLRKDYPIDKRQPLIGPKPDEAGGQAEAGDLRPKAVP